MKELTILITKYLPYSTYFFLIFVRVFGIVYFFPFFNSMSVPWQVKAGLAAIMSFIILPFFKFQVISFDIWELGIAVIRELCVGLSLGFIIQIIFDGIHLAGQIVGYQMGFAIVNVIDPYMNTQISIIARFKGLLALLIFFSLNAHYLVISGLLKSFELVPIAGWTFKNRMAAQLVRWTGDIFIMALKIASPVLVTLFLTNIALALIARTMPQINVFIIGFPLEIGIGFLMLGITMPFFSWCFRQFFEKGLYEMWFNLRLGGL